LIPRERLPGEDRVQLRTRFAERGGVAHADPVRGALGGSPSKRPDRRLRIRDAEEGFGAVERHAANAAPLDRPHLIPRARDRAPWIAGAGHLARRDRTPDAPRPARSVGGASRAIGPALDAAADVGRDPSIAG